MRQVIVVDTGEKIKALRIQHGMTLEELGKKVGVGKSTVRKWETGMIANMGRDKIGKLATVFGVSPTYLISNDDSLKELARETVEEQKLLETWRQASDEGRRNFAKFLESSWPDNIIPMPQMNTVPLLGEIACGDPILAEENFEGEVTIPDNIHADFALRCQGDSMINARIHDGDIVYIRAQSEVNNGEIAAVLIDENATLKRVYFYPESNKIVLNPENPKCEPYVYVGEEIASVHILGKAIAFTSVL